MNWFTAKKYYGLQAPFDFRIALPFLLNGLGLVLCLVACMFLILTDNLTVGTERFYFFGYVVFMFIVAAALSPRTLLSMGLFCWCVLELSLAFSSKVLEPAIGASIFPRNSFTQQPDSRFVYHPLLQRSLRRNWEQIIRYDSRNWRRAPWPQFFTSRYFDQDFLFFQNSLGLRGAEIAPGDLEKPAIFLYGGSTTYDFTVTQGATWAESLQQELDGKFLVLNLGVPVYGTTEHVIQTAFYQGVIEKKPVCAIYYVGFNDIMNAHVRDLDPAYANHLLLFSAVRKPDLWAARYSPLLRLISNACQKRFDSVALPAQAQGAFGSGNDPRLERLFIEHIRAIAAINSSRDIKTVFIGQMWNRELLNSTPLGVRSVVTFVSPQDISPLQERFNSILMETALSVGAGFIDPGIDNFNDADFTDGAHFATAGSRKFAKIISKDVKDQCQ